MPPRYAAAVTCPSCGTPYRTPIEQILDVRVDPSARNRMLSGSVNVAVCPTCGAGGALSLPFIYHDPEREVALLYLPVESGANEIQRQQGAGRLARQLMDSMPPEERKGYLLQPETFINLETMVKRVLELEGVTQDDLDRSQRQRELLDRLMQAEQPEWGTILAEGGDLVDEALFSLMEYMLQLASMSGPEGADFAKMREIHEYAVTETDLGKRLLRRIEVTHRFADDPSSATLLQALIDAPDDETVTALVQTGTGLLDYAFFQSLVKQIQDAPTQEKERLTALRRRILELRDEAVKANQALANDRALLLGKLLGTEDPVRMANSHLSELDNLFFLVLGSQLEQAQQQNDSTKVERLQKVAHAVDQVMESHMPPEMAITRRLLMATSDEQLSEMLGQMGQLLSPPFLRYLEAIEAASRERGETDVADRMAHIRELAQRYAPAAEPAAPQVMQPAAPQPPQRPSDDETRTPSGLIIAKR